MDVTRSFRTLLARRLFLALGASLIPAGAACGSETEDGSSGCFTTTQPGTECLAPSQGAGGSGGSGAIVCPSIDAARAQIATNVGALKSVDGEAMITDGECCYPVTYNVQECGAGRPLSIDGRAVTAEAQRRAAGWSARRAAPRIVDLPPELRLVLAEAWKRDALLEHASVASFALFSLELLALGAPADLVTAAHAAALDEVEHARSCFALASAYAEDELGPGRLALGAALPLRSSLEELVAAVAREGCLGETIAAVVAVAQLGEARDPAVRRVLRKIARDEARHAELAWRTLAWAMRAGPRALADVAGQALAHAPQLGMVDDLDHPLARAHGRIGARELDSVVTHTMHDVIVPAAQHLGVRLIAWQ